MFFRREKPRKFSASERLEKLRGLGFETANVAGGGVRVTRNGIGANLKEEGGELRAAGKAGLVMGSELGVLVDGGYQKFFSTPTGVKRPAQAEFLKALHAFEEDLKEGLDIKSLYNEGLGTVSAMYLYDRVKDRDRGVPKRAWE